MVHGGLSFSGATLIDDTVMTKLEKLMPLAPSRALVTIEDVGGATAFLATDYAKLITGDTMYVEGGYHVVG